MQHLETNTDSPGPYRDKENPTVSMHVPLMIGTIVSHNLGIPTSRGNFVSCVQVYGSKNMSSDLANQEP